MAQGLIQDLITSTSLKGWSHCFSPLNHEIFALQTPCGSLLNYSLDNKPPRFVPLRGKTITRKQLEITTTTDIPDPMVSQDFVVGYGAVTTSTTSLHSCFPFTQHREREREREKQLLALAYTVIFIVRPLYRDRERLLINALLSLNAARSLLRRFLAFLVHFP